MQRKCLQRCKFGCRNVPSDPGVRQRGTPTGNEVVLLIRGDGVAVFVDGDHGAVLARPLHGVVAVADVRPRNRVGAGVAQPVGVGVGAGVAAHGAHVLPGGARPDAGALNRAESAGEQHGAERADAHTCHPDASAGCGEVEACSVQRGSQQRELSVL